MPGNLAFEIAWPARLAICEERQVVSMTSNKTPGNGPLTIISVRAAAGNPRRGWLAAGRLAIPVALGRGGIRADKREGDGATPRGTFRLVRLWFRADRGPRPMTRLPVRHIRADDAWCEDPADRRYNRPFRVASGQ